MSDSAIRAINSSGFPLQIAIANLVRSNRCRDWGIAYEEHAWTDESSGRSGFIDLVITSDSQVFNLVVECNRVRDTSWIFICESEAALKRLHAKGWLRSEQGSGYHDWADVVMNYESPESAFCVVRGNASRTPMLERVASELAASTRAFAFEQSKHFGDALPSSVLTFNLIVTTAELQVATLDPTKISLADGNVPDDIEVKTVPFVRFRKQLTTDSEVSISVGAGSQELQRQKEQTVFVVNSEGLLEFLTYFDLDRLSVEKILR